MSETGTAVPRSEQWGALTCPNSVSELRQSLSEALGANRYVTIRGAGVHQHLGNATRSPDVLIDTTGLSRVVAHEPADMTVTVETGVRLGVLQQALAQHGQFLPLDPAPSDDATIGGVLAANVSGPLRHRFGTARDWLLGVRVVLADGSIVKSGGQVVKNVSGYDLHKIFVGSLGTLGVIAEATLKVAPLPRVDRTFAISCSSAAEATGVIVSAHEATLALSAAELLSPTVASALIGNGAWTALVRVAGGQAATARTSDDLDELASLARGSIEEHPSGLWSAWRGHFSPSVLALCISIVPSRVGETAESLDRAFAGESAHLSATVSAGLIRLNLAPRNLAGCDLLVERARAIAEQRGGFLVVEEAPSDYKRTIDVFGRERGDIEIMRRLKQQFDPAGILAQGRFVGRI